MSEPRTAKIAPVLLERKKAGVRTIVVVSRSQDTNPVTSAAGQLLQRAGVTLLTAQGMHEKLITVDEHTLYVGSLNPLSHGGTTEFMERITAPRFVKKVRDFLDVDAFTAPQPHDGLAIYVDIRELPSGRCPVCSNGFVPRLGKYGLFYACLDRQNCGKTQDITEEHLTAVNRLHNIVCSNCQSTHPMRLKIRRKDAWLECGAQTACGFRRRIEFTRQ